MNSNSDDAYEKLKDYDFADAKPVPAVPVLAHLQAEKGGKTTTPVPARAEITR